MHSFHRTFTAAHPVKVLLIEDEVRSQRLARISLEPLGYQVIIKENASDIQARIEQDEPDIIVLDMKLPDGDGYEVCQDIRAFWSIPIIIVSSYSQSLDKIRGFELGADDYLIKPYDPIELAARIDAILRRVHGQPLQHTSIFHCNGLTVNFDEQKVVLDGHEVILTRTEYRLLEYLAHNAGRILVADTILANVWGPEYGSDYAPLHLYISRLRRKLGDKANAPQYITTRPGIGYMMASGELYGSRLPQGV